MDQYAVFGNPIAHSKSPVIHSLFAKQTGQALQYEKKLIAEDGFAAAAREFFSHGGKGLNITVPFKLAAYEFADHLSKRARQAGAVNTLKLEADGTVFGDNTDGVGMVRDITENLAWPISDKNVLILGAGGAVRGVIAPVMEQSPKSLVIVNRTASKAQQLAQAFSKLGRIIGCGYDALSENLTGVPFDVVINGTAASLSGDLPPLPEAIVNRTSACYDMMYAATDTVFLTWAKRQHVSRCADGLGMLVEQAAESFALWRGVRPQTAEVIATLRESLSND